MVSVSPHLAILVIPMLGAVVGAFGKGEARPRVWALAGSALVGVVFGVLAATTHEPGVPIEDAVFGVVVAGSVVGFLPPYLFWRLGRALSEHRLLLGFACAAAAVPLGFFYLLGWLYVLAVVHCPPDAYECPV